MQQIFLYASAICENLFAPCFIPDMGLVLMILMGSVSKISIHCGLSIDDIDRLNTDVFTWFPLVHKLEVSSLAK